MSLENADNQVDTNNISDDEEVIIQFEGDEESHTSDTDEPESSVIKDLRRQVRQQAQDLAKLKPTTNQETITLGDKPTLEGCDYDTDKFETDYEAYLERKRKIAQQEKDKETRLTQEQQANQTQLQKYEQQVRELKVKDFDAKQQEFLDTFKDTQQGRVIIKAAKNKALVVYALGSDPKKLEQLAAITDDIELAIEVAKIEGKIKVQPKQNNIKPEGTVRGSAASPSSSAVKTQLAKLEADAAKTGNRTAIVKFKKANNLI